MPGRLIRIRSYLTVWEADWQRSLLADAGIPSCVDSCALVLWFWHYTQAVGGVKLYIDPAQWDDAAALLAGSMPDDCESTEPPLFDHDCPQCGAELPAGWEVCWRCSPAAEIKLDSEKQSVAEHDSPPPIAVPVALTLLLTWVVIRHGLIAGAEFFALIVAVRIWLKQWTHAPPSVEPPDADAAAPDPPRRTQAGNALALRLWHAAVLGCLSFPPLLLYALYLLVRPGWRRFELSPLARARYWGAIAAVLLSVVRWGGLFLAFYPG